MGDFLPRDISRVLYLDCDTLALGDVRELFYVDLKGKALGMVRDVHAKNVHLVRDGGVDFMNYFNSGVILIDLKMWRDKVFEDFELMNDLQYCDQDFLNLSFKNEIKALPFAYNFMWCSSCARDFETDEKRKICTCIYNKNEFYKTLKRPNIVHLLWQKPWKSVEIKNPYDEFWWQAAQNTPFYSEICAVYEGEKAKIDLEITRQKEQEKLHQGIGKFKLGRSIKKRFYRLKNFLGI